MGQDEKTLRIVVSKDSGNPSLQQQPSAPPSPSAPANPSAPAQPPSNQTSPSAPPSPTVTLPKSPPQIPTGTTPTPATPPAAPVAPAVPASPVAPAAGAAASTAAGAASVIGPALVAVGVFTAALGAASLAVHILDGKFSEMTDRLKEYDPGLAVASGVSQIRKIQADIQAAHDRSGVLQQFTQRKTDLEISASHIETFLTNNVGPILNKGLDFLTTISIITEGLLGKVQQFETAIQAHIPNWIQTAVPIFWDWREINQKLARWLGVQLADDTTAATFQQDIRDAIDPHGALASALRGEANTRENGITPRGIEL